jgi:hypothetical protein
VTVIRVPLESLAIEEYPVPAPLLTFNEEALIAADRSVYAKDVIAGIQDPGDV